MVLAQQKGTINCIGDTIIFLCPSIFQDLAESDPLETDVAFVSNVVPRAARLSGKASGRNFRIWIRSA